jgi:hypothetical protein
MLTDFYRGLKISMKLGLSSLSFEQCGCTMFQKKQYTMRITALGETRVSINVSPSQVAGHSCGGCNCAIWRDAIDWASESFKTKPLRKQRSKPQVSAVFRLVSIKI